MLIETFSVIFKHLERAWFLSHTRISKISIQPWTTIYKEIVYVSKRPITLIVMPLWRSISNVHAPAINFILHWSNSKLLDCYSSNLVFPYLPSSSSSFIELIWLLTPSRLLDILVFHNLTIFNGSLLAFSINPFIQSYKRNYRWSNVAKSIIFQFNIYPGSFSLSVTFLGKRKSRSHRSLLSIKMSGVGDFRWHYQPHKSVKPSSRQTRDPRLPPKYT